MSTPRSVRAFACGLLSHLSGPQGFASFHAPGIFIDQVAEAAFCRVGIGLAVVEGMHARQVRHRVEGTMNVTALAILRDHLVALFKGEFPFQGVVEFIGLTGS